MIEPLARLGYASKAFIYCTVGVLALMAALQRGGHVTDTRGALRVILSQPLGNAVLFVLAAGLCGYAIWRALDAILDPDRRGTTFKGLAVRIGNLVKALVYVGVGIEAFRLAQGLRASSGTDRRVRLWTGRVMELPFGEWIIGVTGLIVIGYGAAEIVGALKHRDDIRLDLSSMRPDRRRILLAISRFGVAARALIIVVLGFFLVRAALQHDPGQAQGIRGSVLELASGVEGRWILGAIALGLIAYAVDQALHARYRRIRSPI
jgi:Domain of Unknown Function (DUF1206)